MLKGRCATCTAYVNCSRRGRGCTAPKSRKRTFAEIEEKECENTAIEAFCASCDKNKENELEILRRNVQCLAATSNTAKGHGMVTLIINEIHQITAHRSILASVSPVFEKMFSLGMLEKETGRLSINEASLSRMKAVVNYSYTADITFTNDMDLEEVAHVSHKYQMKSFTWRCETELSNRFRSSMKIAVNLSTALGMTEKGLTTADRYEMDRLSKTCLNELHLRKYMLKDKYGMDALRKTSVKEYHLQNYAVKDRSSPRSFAKLIHLSFRFGPEQIQDDIYTTVQNLNGEEGKQVWMEVINMSLAPKD